MWEGGLACGSSQIILQPDRKHPSIHEWNRVEWESYLQLLIVAGARLAGGLELLAHLADLVVRLGELCGRHFVGLSLLISLQHPRS